MITMFKVVNKQKVLLLISLTSSEDMLGGLSEKVWSSKEEEGNVNKESKCKQTVDDWGSLNAIRLKCINSCSRFRNNSLQQQKFLINRSWVWEMSHLRLSLIRWELENCKLDEVEEFRDKFSKRKGKLPATFIPLRNIRSEVHFKYEITSFEFLMIAEGELEAS